MVEYDRTVTERDIENDIAMTRQKIEQILEAARKLAEK